MRISLLGVSLSLLLFACSSNGTQGPGGATGPTGATGSAGLAGATGSAGATGLEGAMGLEGATGATGVAGADGLQGAVGSPGAKGPTGATGAAGVNVTSQVLAVGNSTCAAGGVQYTSADGVRYVCNGFNGDAGVAGATGASGTQGPQGIQGNQGAQGIQGATGATGIQGAQGIQGATGATGIQGAQGIQGATGGTGGIGATGAQGIQGIAGVKGDQGDAGVNVIGASLAVGNASCPAGGTQYTSADGVHYVCNGFNGDAGPQGIQGIQGVQGTQGNQGIQGVQGVAGATGAIGATGATGAAGTNGTSPVVAVQGPLHLDGGTLSIDTATAFDAGVLTAADWTTFNNKVSSTDPRLSDARAPSAGSSFYLQASPASPQAANLSISGTGFFGSSVSVDGGVSATSFTGSGAGLSGVVVTTGNVTGLATYVTNIVQSYDQTPSTLASSSAALQLANTDPQLVLIDSSTHPVTVTLPASPATGREFTIKDINGTAGTNAITVSAGSSNIEGSSTFLVNSAYGYVNVLYSGSRWNILGQQIPKHLGPALEAYASGTASLGNGNIVQIPYDNRDLDTDGSLDTVQHRFKPPKAGYYQIGVNVEFNLAGNPSGTLWAFIYRNGTAIKESEGLFNYGAAFVQTLHVEAITYLNGTTDYIEGYALTNNGSGATLRAGGNITYMIASYVHE